MRSMTMPVFVTVISTLCGSVGAQSTPSPVPVPPAKPPIAASPALVGTWDAIARSSGGIGSTVLFSVDGFFALVLGAMVEVKYRVNGNTLTYYGEEGGRSVSDTQSLTFRGDTAILSSRGCRITLLPLEAQPTRGSVIGQWRFTHLTGVPAYQDFSAEGSGRLRVPLQVQKGTYSVGENTIGFYTLTPSPADWTAQFTLQSDTLTLWNEAGQHRYVRSRPLIPMSVEQPSPPGKLLC